MAGKDVKSSSSYHSCGISLWNFAVSRSRSRILMCCCEIVDTRRSIKGVAKLKTQDIWRTNKPDLDRFKAQGSEALQLDWW